MKHHLVDLYQVCSDYAYVPCAKYGPALVVKCYTEACIGKNLKKSSCLKPLPEFLPNLAEMILIWSSLIFVQMVLVCCISMSRRLKLDFQKSSGLKEQGLEP